MAKRIEIAKIPVKTGSGYPTPFDLPCAARARQRLSDAAGLTARRTVTITIAPPALGISTPRQLPDVALNGVYLQTLTAIGGRPPYTWSATGLPGGLALNALITITNP